MLVFNTIQLSDVQVEPPTARQPPMPAEAYARHARRCATLLKALDAALWDHALSAAEEPHNRGYLVELAVLDHRLAEALAGLAGQDDARVQRLLAEVDVSV